MKLWNFKKNFVIFTINLQHFFKIIFNSFEELIFCGRQSALKSCLDQLNMYILQI